MNPYLSHAAVLAAIAHGLDDRLDPGPPQAGDSYDPGVSGAYAKLPGTLGDALALLEADEVVRGALAGRAV